MSKGTTEENPHIGSDFKELCRQYPDIYEAYIEKIEKGFNEAKQDVLETIKLARHGLTAQGHERVLVHEGLDELEKKYGGEG